MSQHTPGPWTLSKSPMAATFVMKDETWLAEVSCVPESEANARLIAAAPEMLDLLQQVVTGVNFARQPNHPPVNAARALLARIEGT